MRKVFFSTTKLSDPNLSAIFKSRDFELGNKQHFAPIAYLLDANIDSDDEIVIITNVMQAPNPQKNYELLKKDMDEILAAHNAKATFIVISEPNPKTNREEMDSLTFSRYFKELSEYFQDGDRIYADMTFGMKCNTICSLIAMSYAVKAGMDIDVERMVYSELYYGETKEETPTSDIIDITSIFYINTLVNNARSGQKTSIDNFLNFMIG